MEISGNLFFKGETVKRTETFAVREFVIEVINPRNSKYNNYIQFQLTNDRCGLIENYNIGDQLHVTFDIQGRRWQSPEGRVAYFNSLNAWKVEPLASVIQNEMGQSAPAMPVTPSQAPAPMETKDDLPF